MSTEHKSWVGSPMPDISIPLQKFTVELSYSSHKWLTSEEVRLYLDSIINEYADLGYGVVERVVGA